MLVLNMISTGEKCYKYFIAYKDVDYEIKPLRIALSIRRLT